MQTSTLCIIYAYIFIIFIPYTQHSLFAGSESHLVWYDRTEEHVIHLSVALKVTRISLRVCGDRTFASDTLNVPHDYFNGM
jgi:hypothetical protein